MHKISFTLGDPGGDGHANTSEYHIVSTHSVDEIEEAYNKVKEMIGFDFVKEIGAEYEGPYYLTKEQTKSLLNVGIINERHVNHDDSYEWCPVDCYEIDYAEEWFVHTFFALIKLIIPDFDWHYRDLQETNLDLLYGAAYGFAYHGE